MGNQAEHTPLLPLTDLASLLNKRYAVTSDRPAKSSAARQAELKEWAKAHKAYAISYAKRENPYKIVQPNRKGSTERPSDK